MKRVAKALGSLALGLLIVSQIPVAAQDKQPESMATTTLKVGDVAPDFTLISNKEEPVKLSDYHGKKNVILAFYVLAFTGG